MSNFINKHGTIITYINSHLEAFNKSKSEEYKNEAMGNILPKPAKSVYKAVNSAKDIKNDVNDLTKHSEEHQSLESRIYESVYNTLKFYQAEAFTFIVTETVKKIVEITSTSDSFNTGVGALSSGVDFIIKWCCEGVKFAVQTGKTITRYSGSSLEAFFTSGQGKSFLAYMESTMGSLNKTLKNLPVFWTASRNLLARKEALENIAELKEGLKGLGGSVVSLFSFAKSLNYIGFAEALLVNPLTWYFGLAAVGGAAEGYIGNKGYMNGAIPADFNPQFNYLIPHDIRDKCRWLQQIYSDINVYSRNDSSGTGNSC